MTSLNDTKEDPTGFRIEEVDDGWQWVRLADTMTKGGFATRDEAIEDAEAT